MQSVRSGCFRNRFALGRKGRSARRHDVLHPMPVGLEDCERLLYDMGGIIDNDADFPAGIQFQGTQALAAQKHLFSIADNGLCM